MKTKNLTLLFLIILSARTLKAEPKAEGVSYISHDGVKIVGEVLIPESGEGEDIFPAVLMIGGSGPTDMDESIRGNLTVDGKPAKIFKPIAHYLAQRGFIVLRYHKRGIEGYDEENQRPIFSNSEVLKNASWRDLVYDAKSGVEYLRSLSHVDPKKISILGHSEGTMVATDLAFEDADIKSLLLLGYSGWNYSTTLFFQFITRIEDFLNRSVDTDKDNFLIQEEIDVWSATLNLPITQFDRNSDGKLSISEEVRSGLFQQYDTAARTFKNRYRLIRDLWDVDSFNIKASQLEQPIFVIQGELDQQTPVFCVYELMDACKANSKDNLKVKILPGLGHGFSPPRSPRREPFADLTLGPIDAALLDAIQDWIDSN